MTLQGRGVALCRIVDTKGGWADNDDVLNHHISSRFLHSPIHLLFEVLIKGTVSRYF